MRRRWSYLVFPVATCLVFLSACKPTVPSRYLQPDEMEDLIYDYYVAQGLSYNHAVNSDYQHFYHLESVLRKYNLTSAELDSSLVYYYNNMELMNVVYSNVQKRLSKEALELGASEGEVERYTTQSLSGDTTDVWESRRFLMLMPTPPYHIAQFTQKADTSFHKGDSFLLTFGSKFLAQSGSRNATAFLSVTYENDSVVTVSQIINIAGGTTLRLNPCSLKAKRIDGFMYMAKRDNTDNENDLCLLFIDQIQLMRFHNEVTSSNTETSEIPPADSHPIEKKDTLVPQVRRLGDRPLPEKKEETLSPSASNRQMIKDIKPTISR